MSKNETAGENKEKENAKKIIIKCILPVYIFHPADAVWRKVVCGLFCRYKYDESSAHRVN